MVPPSDREKHVMRDVVAQGVQRVYCRQRIQSTTLIRRMQACLNVRESSGCNLYGAIDSCVYHPAVSSIFALIFSFLFLESGLAISDQLDRLIMFKSCQLQNLKLILLFCFSCPFSANYNLSM